MNGRINRIWPEFLRKAPQRVLELGPLDGRDTVLLARECREVIAIEGRINNVTDTRDAVYGDGLGNVDVRFDNLETCDLAVLGRFDCVWASGILYHLPAPWDLVRRIAGVSDVCLGWTHVATDERDIANGYGGWHYIEDKPETSRLSGLSGRSFWLTESEFVRMWNDVNFWCRFYSPPQPHTNGGLAGQFIAEKLDA